MGAYAPVFRIRILLYGSNTDPVPDFFLTLPAILSNFIFTTAETFKETSGF